MLEVRELIVRLVDGSEFAVRADNVKDLGNGLAAITLADKVLAFVAIANLGMIYDRIAFGSQDGHAAMTDIG